MIRDIVLMKLNAVGLRGAAGLRIAEVSGGMARRIALARAIALDPELIMYDEPFAGPGPDQHGRGRQADPHAQRRHRRHLAGVSATTCPSAWPSATRGAAGHRRAHRGPGHAGRADGLTDPEVRQFVRGEPDGPVKFHYPAPRRWPRTSAGTGA
jgi:phospholipid/cholesterol/gamma-HCH transport system ATP-binding protein